MPVLGHGRTPAPNPTEAMLPGEEGVRRSGRPRRSARQAASRVD